MDADACPVAIRKILFRAAARTGTRVTLVANQPLQIPASPAIGMLRVASGYDVADNEIVRRLAAGDLVVTGDIPLAAGPIAKGGIALSPRGELHARENIGARLNLRDFIERMRASGIDTGGPPALGRADRKAFAGAPRPLVGQAKAGIGKNRGDGHGRER